MPIPSTFAVDIVYKGIKTQISVQKDIVSDCRSLVVSFKDELYSHGDKGAPIQTPIELHSQFLKYCADHDEPVAVAILGDFENRLLCGKNIHLVCNELKLTKEQICTVLNGYYSAWVLLPLDKRPASAPALFNSDSVKLMALFGGQGGAVGYFDELLFMYRAYYPLVAEFVKHISSFLSKAASNPQVADMYEHGLQLDMWLDNPETVPSPKYLSNSSVSGPLTGFTQLLQFMVTFKTLGITPGELTRSFKVAIGHSNGIVVASAISCSTDEKSFYANSLKTLGILIPIGIYKKVKSPLSLSSIESEDSDDSSGNHTPRPMVSVRGLNYNQLSALVDKFNSKYGDRYHPVSIALINTQDHFVVSSDTSSAAIFAQLARSECASPEQDQSRIPYLQREPVASIDFVNTTMPGHCSILSDMVDYQHQYTIDNGYIFSSSDMQIPVRANDDGRDISAESDLTKYLLQSISVLPVNWPVAVDYPGITHIVDFGPGGTRGFGILAHRNIEGRGVSIICAGAPTPGTPGFGTRADIYKSKLSSIPKTPNWTRVYSPTLVHTIFDNKLHISTKMSRLLGKPPIMVAGMTPTTVNEDLVASVLNSGYHVELACGGVHTRSDLKTKVANLVDSIEPGFGITLNLVYLNQNQWSFQLPEIVEMRKKGVPIEGICIGGGVPSVDVATEIIDTIHSAGLRHITFKPGSVESIIHVIKIAKASPTFPVMLQWTGGRGGGHHSFEDFHRPVLDTYSIIRRLRNVVLVAGSGFGGADDTFPYLTGEWSTRFGYAPMPFDGVLFGSRMMIAKESKAADGVKELIASAPGVSDCEWEHSYIGSAGGVITIKSELGQPMHVIANRCSLFWKELDDTVFSAPRKDHLKIILDKRDHIISHLNSDHTRPWFGTMPDGRIVDIEDMTYLEVATRLVDLHYIKEEGRWAHASHGALFNTFLIRVEERFTDVYSNNTLTTLGVVDPYEKIECISAIYPVIAIQLMTSEDVKYFVDLCKRRGQKPVSFVPALDDAFEMWFKKDTIWQSEDLACVPHRDPQRVIILQGPVAAQYSTEINTPAKDILDETNSTLIRKLLETKYKGKIDKIQNMEYLSDILPTADIPSCIIQSTTDTEWVFTLPDDTSTLPDNSTWAKALAGNQPNWVYVLLTTPCILCDKSLIPNNIRTVLRPRSNNTVRVVRENSKPIIIEVINANKRIAVRVSSENNNSIDVVIYNHFGSRSASLQLRYIYSPNHAFAPLAKSNSFKSDSEIVLFRESMKLGASGAFDAPNTTKGHLSSSFDNYRISKDRLVQYLKELGHPEKQFKCGPDGKLFVPIDYIFVLVQQMFIDCIPEKHYTCDLLRLFHQSNLTTLIPDTKLLYTGDIISASMCVATMVNTTYGLEMKMRTVITRGIEKIVEMITTIVIGNTCIAIEETFSTIEEAPMRVTLKGSQGIMILRSKEWFLPNNSTIEDVYPGSVLEFVFQSKYRFKKPGIYSSVIATGRVLMVTGHSIPIHIGNIDYHSSTSFGNPVTEYLKRFGTPFNSPVYFSSGGYPLFQGKIGEKEFIKSPQSNHTYSYISGDYNPVHTNVYIADYVGLPTTVTHGMLTSTNNRTYIDHYAAGDHPERVVAYQTKFVGLVFPGDNLIPSFDHVGMKDGRMFIKGDTVNQDGNRVLEFTAEVEQPPIAYVFTGQGSQHVGMGMDLYKSSEAARSVWDKGNRHFIDKYGLSILNIIQKNPTKHTIHFDGKRGSKIRDNYIGLIPDILKTTHRFTFTSPKGLLHMTQFTQPALVLFELAVVADMKEKGLLQSSSLFAGHSLGEYSALCAMGDIFSLEDILDIVFCRGLLMQQLVGRNGAGQSEYQMVAVNPSSIGADFGEKGLVAIVESIKTHGSGLLEIVNYNIKNKQYVVAGTIQQLRALTIALDELLQNNNHSTELIGNIIQRSILQAADEMSRLGGLKIERGIAIVPLSDIDIPFHSSLLQPAIEPLRQKIWSKIKSTYIDYTRLESRYIPNLIGESFELSREYLKKIFDLTNSVIIKGLFDGWDTIDWADDEMQQQVIQILLVELLALQVAHSVKWTATQSYILDKARVERVIEIGPSSTLANMAKQSANTTSKKISVLSVAADEDAIYYRNKQNTNKEECRIKSTDQKLVQDTGGSISKDDFGQNQNQAHKITKVTLQAQPLSSLVSSQPVVLIPDMPLDALFVIKVMISQKIKRSVSSIPNAKSVGELVKGKSVLQNELLGAFKREFGSDIFDVPEEITLEELASKITPFSGTLGEYTTDQISRLLRNKFPGGFSRSDVHSYLEATYGLGPQRSDGVLLLALTYEPESRLSNDTEVKSWLDGIVLEYAAIHNITFQKYSATGSSTDGHISITASDLQVLEKIKQNQKYLSKQLIEVYAKNIDIDLRDGDRTAEQAFKERDALQTSLDKLNNELGSEFISGIGALFDSLKIRRFDSYWNWALQDALVLVYSILNGAVDLKSTKANERIHMLKVRSTPALISVLAFHIKQIKSLNEGNSMNFYLPAITTIYKMCKESIDALPTYSVYQVPTRPRTFINDKHRLIYNEVPDPSVPTRDIYIEKMCASWENDKPLVHIQTRTNDNTWAYNPLLTSIYLDTFSKIYSSGLTFSGMHVLITGCGKTSIGEELLKGLLCGGAKVVATTSSYSRKTMLYFEDIYKNYGSCGSELIVVPFNQGSVDDIKRLIGFIYSSPDRRNGGLGWDLDVIIPFAALPNQLGDITVIGSHAEISFRAMLTNVHRLLGEVVSQKIKLDHSTRITRAILPFSVNHGQFGGGGLYSESKVALETLMNRWHSESWSEYMSVIGATIGWTRGTSQMINSSIASEYIEKLNAYTFTTSEMAAFILSALSDSLCAGDVIEPVIIDISGRCTNTHMKGILMTIRNMIVRDGSIRKEIAIDLAHDIYTVSHSDAGYTGLYRPIDPRANCKPQFPKYRSYEDLSSLHYMQGMVNLDKVVVVTGFGEVGPYGHSKTRWEMEAHGKFSLEGCVELAWVMGYIKFFSGTLESTGKQYTGWVDSKTGEPVNDVDVKAHYENDILKHTGIRLIEPELHNGYDPNKKYFIRELQIEHDMEPFETSKEEAEHFKLQNGDKVDSWKNEDGSWSVRFLKGAIIAVPKAFASDRTVIGQVPTGWDPVRYGIPEDIAKQIDPSTSYGLVAMVEAMLRSGITDPYELYKYIHVSKVGSTIGAGLPSKVSLHHANKGQFMDLKYPSDVAQESLIGIVAAWSNMLLLSSSGPIKPVSGACATSILSIDVAVETIQSGKAEVILTGGFDDYEQTSSHEYGRLGATVNSLDDIEHGRTPAEMSRPCTTTRNGFMESEGVGVAVLMSASTAIKMGAPIYGIIALSNTATDKAGKSIPAPGQGILTTARESIQDERSDMLDFDYRKAKLERHIQFIDQWQSEIGACSKSESEKLKIMRKGAQDEWGNEFWKNDNSISPLRGSLAVWGLGIDNIGAVSFHGTSTVVNDVNESDVFNTQFKHLGRTPGNVVPVIAQKWLTGHPKGGAAAWMLNGMLQVLDTGIVPGNRNADNIEKKLEQFEYLVYPSKSIQTQGVKAGLLKSFGFGQAGGELLVVHPDYILATLSLEELGQYQDKVKEREKKVYRYWHDTFVGKHPFVQVKDKPPYTKEQEKNVYLDPNARAKYDPKTKKYHF